MYQKLFIGSLLISLVVLTGCELVSSQTPQPVPSPSVVEKVVTVEVEKEVEKIVTVEVPVEVTKVVIQPVESTVVVTKVVTQEVMVVVTATPNPTLVPVAKPTVVATETPMRMQAMPMPMVTTSEFKILAHDAAMVRHVLDVSQDPDYLHVGYGFESVFADVQRLEAEGDAGPWIYGPSSGDMDMFGQVVLLKFEQGKAPVFIPGPGLHIPVPDKVLNPNSDQPDTIILHDTLSFEEGVIVLNAQPIRGWTGQVDDPGRSGQCKNGCKP